MIFVSTSCLKKQYISEAVTELAQHGFKNIELSGGTVPYDRMLDDLLELKDKFQLNYRCHNYFPPPTVPFVLNLASLDEGIYRMSFEHVEKALTLSEKLGATKYGFHAGFLINISIDEVGKVIKQKTPFDRKQAEEQFLNSVKILQQKTPSVQIYIENNVISEKNYLSFEKTNPLLMTSSDDVVAYQKRVDFKLLLDIAHLKVSCHTLGMDFVSELEKLMRISDYVHISDNNGLEDSNHSIAGTEVVEILKRFSIDLKTKDYTLEVYTGMVDINKSYETLEKVING
jgi:sugar phosphate isomerase/epimerase